MLTRRISSVAVSLPRALSWRCEPPQYISTKTALEPHSLLSFRPKTGVLTFCSGSQFSSIDTDSTPLEESSKHGPLKPGLYLVGTPIGNLEDITLRALRILKSAHVILSEDTRHSGKLLQHFNIRTPLLSFHKFNESQREQTVLKRLKQGEIVALISDAGTPGISDPGSELVRLCVDENIPVIPIPGPSAVVAALSASGLSTNEFSFVGFVPRHAGSRKERLVASANEMATQIFYVPPHKLKLFLEETLSVFGESRRCVIAREMTKIHEEFWRGTLAEAKEIYSLHQPKGEITLLIEGKQNSAIETPSGLELEKELEELISSGHRLSMVSNVVRLGGCPVRSVEVHDLGFILDLSYGFPAISVVGLDVCPKRLVEAVKLVASRSSASRKTIYSIALRKFGNQRGAENESC